MRLELVNIQFPKVVDLSAKYQITESGATTARTHQHADIYQQALEDFDSTQTLGELQSRLIPPRASPTDACHHFHSRPPVLWGNWFRLYRLALNVANHNTNTTSTTELEKCDEANGARATSAVASDSDQQTIEYEDLPTLEQLVRDYDPSVQHLDSFMLRHFYFPALEELVLKNCVEQAFGQSFLARLVRHLTRFRESDAPHSQTPLRRVDLRGSKIYDEDSAVRLMGLLAPNVKIMAEPNWSEFVGDGWDSSGSPGDDDWGFTDDEPSDDQFAYDDYIHDDFEDDEQF